MDSKIKDLQDLKMIDYYRRWEPYMRKYNCQTVAEIGVYKGSNFCNMIKHGPKLAVAVDSWIDDGILSRNDGAWKQTELDAQYARLKQFEKRWPHIKVCRGYSFDVVKRFPNEYFDLIYIDADHSFEGCYQDLKDWFPKVKNGGAFLGDDYRKGYVAKHTGVKFGVVEAVDKFVKEKNLNLFLLSHHGWGVIK
jgi:hypothetical protein